MLMTMEEALYRAYITELGEIDGVQTIFILNDHSVYHVFMKDNMFKLSSTQNPQTIFFAFIFDNRYSSYEFQGIMPDSEAAGISLAGEPQVQVLQKKDLTIQLDTAAAGSNTIRFGKGTATVKGVVQVPTPLGTITFHVVPTNTPFLLCLQDIDAIGVRFNNLKNILI
jgi:hypothetical protein